MEPMKRLTIIYGAPQEISKSKNKKKHIVTNGNVQLRIIIVQNNTSGEKTRKLDTLAKLFEAMSEK